MARDEKTGEHPLAPEAWDWEEAFGYAGEPGTCATSYQDGPDLRRADPQDTATPLTPFTRADVAEIVSFAEGENDSESWLCWGRLHDGRWFLLDAWCDYTGWDCQAGGTVTLAPSREVLVDQGMDDAAKSRLTVPA